MRLTARAIRDARAMAGNIYRLNATGANRYGFTVDKNRKEVGYGEFLWPSEKERGFDGIIDLATMTARKANS